jgi:hypothetical protein
VNNKSVYFMLDCGATVNLLPFTDASTVSPKLTALRPAEKRLTMYDGTELKTLGMLTATVEHPLSRKRKRMDFYVAATHDRAILGMEACLDMELLSVNEGNICTVRQDQQSLPPPRAPTPNVASYGNGETVTKAAPSSIRSTDVRQPLMKEIILEQYADLFTGVGRLTGEVHLEIDTTAKPVQMPPRRLPVAIRDRVKHEVDAMCKNGIIEPVNEPSPWVSALLVLQKRNGTLRICIDPKHLNAALKRSVYYMPTIADVLPQLNKAKVFSTVDATQGFNHLCLDAESAALTTFETPFGRYRWLRLCFGISPAPENFQARMHQLTSNLGGCHP